MTQHLTAHFTLNEFTYSNTANKYGIDNKTLTLGTLANILLTAENLEGIRSKALKDEPVTITSGYRCPALNKKIGGSSKNSAHMRGLAADIKCPGVGHPFTVAERILASGVAFDQLIYEGSWVHVGFANPMSECRNQVLTKRVNSKGKLYYINGLYK